MGEWPERQGELLLYILCLEGNLSSVWQGKQPLRGFREQESYIQIDRKINLINSAYFFFPESGLLGQKTLNVITQVICYLLSI